jgi:thiol-disulfide isomerase/thioredoxin
MSQTLSQTPSKRPREVAAATANRLDASVNSPSKKPQPTAEPAAPKSPLTAAEWRSKIAWPEGADARLWHPQMVADADELRALLANRRDDSAVVFIAVAPWCVPQWEACLGGSDPEVRQMLARDAAVEAYFVDVDAIEEATELLEISASQLPSAHSFHRDSSAAPEVAKATKRAQKTVGSPIDIVSLLCLSPVFGLAHLHRRMERSAQAAAAAGKTSFVLCYSGAVWCPPCCRIMPQVGSMLRELNATLGPKDVVVEVVKADRDTSGTIDLVYNVELIPTFQVFRAADAAAAKASSVDAVVAVPAIAPEIKTEDDAEAAAEWEATLTAARKAVVQPFGQLQNSQRPNVAAFLERHCVPLTFDDDF